MKRYGFQVSSKFVTNCLRYIMWWGLNGLFKSGISASSGVLLLFLLLHTTHAVTKFSHVSFPPLERGTTWSIVRWFLLPQYWHSWPSLRMMFFLESSTFLYGKFIYLLSLITVGNGKLSATVRICSSSLDATRSAFIRNKSIIAFWGEQMLIGS